MKRSLPLLAIAAFAPAVAAPPPAKDPLLIHTESRIDVDAQGRVTAISTTPELPADVEKVVHDNLRKLQFAPPMKDGRAVSGVTWAWQDACAAKVDGRYRFAVKFRGNGPGSEQELIPAYPQEMERRGVEAKWTVEYAIAVDGTASIVEIKRLDGGGGRNDVHFRRSIEQWLGAMRFKPELLDGQPVATRMTMPVTYELVAAPRAAKHDARNDACQIALQARDADDRAVAIDSPFKPVIAAN